MILLPDPLSSFKSMELYFFLDHLSFKGETSNQSLFFINTAITVP